MTRNRRKGRGRTGLRNRLPYLLGACLVVIALWVQQTDQPSVRQIRERLDWLVYDLRFDMTQPFASAVEGAPGITIVDIDERSLRNEGHWPWPRGRVAALMDALFDSGAVVVGMDTVFAERQRNPARRVADRLPSQPEFEGLRERLKRVAPRFSGDATLAGSFRGHEVVLGYFLSQDGPGTGALGPPLATPRLPPPGELPVPALDQHVANLPRLQDAAASAGALTVLPEADGTLRRYHLLLGHRGRYYPSLALEMARRYLMVDGVELRTADVGGGRVMDEVGLAGHAVTTDAQGAVLVPYPGEAKSFPYVSATDVLQGEVDKGRLAGRLVLVGSSASGIGDLRATPVQSVYPGVEVHASVLAGLLDNRFPARPNWAEGANFTFMLVFGLVLVVLLPRLRAWSMTAAATAVALSLLVANSLAWELEQWTLPLALPLLLLVALAAMNMMYGFLVEERTRQQLKAMFGQYVPPALVEQLSRDPDSAASMAGERREMSVLFADIRGFTALAETLSATELKDLVNAFFTPMTRVIFEAGGTVDKYVGDMIMAFWGAPISDPEHARNAVTAALAMQKEAVILSDRLCAQGYPALRIGVGINTGTMNVGNMGSDYRRAYTVLGDAVNLGSRLEALTKDYGAGVIVGEHTWRLTRSDFLYRRLDCVAVRGREAAVTIYEPLCRVEEASAALRDQVTAHEAALSAYWDRNWLLARQRFAELANKHPTSAVYQLFLTRLDRLDLESLPSDWGGVFRADSD